MMSAKNKQTPKKIGKPKEYGRVNSSKLKGTESSVDCSGRECVLSFPLLKTVDNDRMLPRYSAILNRTEEDGVGMEDLDALQLELEALLSAVVVRTRVLQEEIGVLNNAEEKQRSGDKKSKPNVNQVHKAPLSPGKRAKQERPMKKLKEISVKSRSIEGNLAPLPIKFTKIKSIPPVSNSRPLPIALPDHDHNDPTRHDAPKGVIPKNDTPNKFWSSIDPYCTDLVHDDIKLIDDLIAVHEKDPDYQKVPALGRHYSLRWAQSDIDEEAERNKLRLKFPSSIFDEKPQSKINDARNERRAEPGNAGTLTQRLLSCLMEENIMVQSQETFDARRNCGVGENAKPPRTLTVGGSSAFEKRMRKELEGQGLITKIDRKEVTDDEIVTELRRCQADLKVISNHNINHLRRLKRLATEEIIRQELKRRLQIADNEVLDVYRKFTAAKQKKKPLTKEEIDHAWKCLKDREVLLRQIDSI